MTIGLDHLTVEAPESGTRALLQDLTIQFNGGEITLLLGCTGSGKTTLLQTIAGLKPPSAGHIALNGEPFWQNGKVPQSILLQMGLVFQFPEQQLFARSIQREFSYSLRPYPLSDEQKKRQMTESLIQWDPPMDPDEMKQRFNPDRSPFALSGVNEEDSASHSGRPRSLSGCCLMNRAPGWKRRAFCFYLMCLNGTGRQVREPLWPLTTSIHFASCGSCSFAARRAVDCGSYTERTSYAA